MDQHSHTPMHSEYMYTPCYSNPPTVASSSSSRRSCFVFGVEFFATPPLLDNGNRNMLVNNAGNNDNASPNIAFGHGNTSFVAGESSQQQMTGLASGNNNADIFPVVPITNADIFPEDAKDLLSTGIFDGIFVAYGGSSREENKRKFSMIHGPSFLCACLKCKGKEYVSARKLEHHAGYETKHPNSGIYFGNGISIFKVVETLRRTPRAELFQAIRTITGSRINEENFRKWKARYLAACSGNGVQQ